MKIILGTTLVLLATTSVFGTKAYKKAGAVSN